MAHLHSDKEDVHTSNSDGEDIPALANKVVVESSDESTESHKGHCRNKSFDSSSDSNGAGPPGLIDRHLVVNSSDDSSAEGLPGLIDRHLVIHSSDDSSAEEGVDIPHVSSGRNCDKSTLPKLLDRDRAKIDSSDESEPKDQPTSSEDPRAEGEVVIPHVSSGHNSAKNTLPKLLDRNRAQVDSSDESEPKDQPTPSGDSPSKDSRLKLPFHLHPSTPFNATINGSRRPGFSAHQDAHRERGSEIVSSEDIVSTNN